MHKLYSVTVNNIVITKPLVTLTEAEKLKTTYQGEKTNTVVVNLELESLIGKTILLTKMEDDPCPIPVGTKGKVYHVSGKNTSMCQICIDWEIQRSLNLCFPKDEFEILSP